MSGSTPATGSPLYQRQIAPSEDDLMHKAWDATPWMVDAYVGPDDRRSAIQDWCRAQFGPEAWPIHGKPGTWYTGTAIIHGWQWIGFATREMLDLFLARWGGTDQ